MGLKAHQVWAFIWLPKLCGILGLAHLHLVHGDLVRHALLYDDVIVTSRATRRDEQQQQKAPLLFFSVCRRRFEEGEWKFLMAAHAPAAAAKKRRPEEGAEEEMHLAFRGAANALSQVYAQAVAKQQASFLAGERRAMEGVYGWIRSKHEEGLEVSVADLVAFLLAEIEHRSGVIPGSLQHTSAQPADSFPSTNVQSNSFSFGNVAAALNSDTAETDQTQIPGMLNALPNPSRENLYSNHLAHFSAYGSTNSLPNINGPQSNHSPQQQNFMHCNSYVPSMDES
uniref:Uncharacterized protein n=1 Tax=Leersia perrieri TaxID=77586 RepID=A0A0D9UXK7_9ORYZ